MNLLSSELDGLDLERFMRAALAEAEAAGRAGEYPIGAVVVIDGVIVSRGRARHSERRSQLAHAEMNALWGGGEALWKNYERAILLTSLEPCPMCLGAVVMADVPHLIYAHADPNVDAQYITQAPYVRRHLRSFYGGVLEEASRAIIQRYDPKMYAYISSKRAAL